MAGKSVAWTETLQACSNGQLEWHHGNNPVMRAQLKSIVADGIELGWPVTVVTFHFEWSADQLSDVWVQRGSREDKALGLGKAEKFIKLDVWKSDEIVQLRDGRFRFETQRAPETAGTYYLIRPNLRRFIAPKRVLVKAADFKRAQRSRSPKR